MTALIVPNNRLLRQAIQESPSCAAVDNNTCWNRSTSFSLTIPSISLTPGDYHAPAHPWHPRTAPRPTDQISGELKEPALRAWLGIDPYIDPTTDETLDIPFAPVTPPDSHSDTTETMTTDVSP